MPRLAIIGTRGYPSYYGGFETAIRYIAPYLADEGWTVRVYGRAGATVDDDPARDSRVESKVSVGLESKSLSTLSHGATAVADAIAWKPDVALVMNVANGFFLPAFRAVGIPTVVNVDGLEWERAKWGKAARTMFRLGAVMTAKTATELVFDAKAIADHWLQHFDRRGTTIPYGGKTYDDDPPPLSEPLDPYSYALLVARFVPENTVGEFFEAVELLGESTPVVLVGTSGYGDLLDAAARRLSQRPNVRWLGHVSDDHRLHGLWAHAGAYFHGHSVGGTNPALVQAMALGAPTLARDTVYNREVLGDAALFTAPEPQAIAENLEELLGNHGLRSILRERATLRARTAYTWDGVCQSYAELLERSLERRKGGSAL